MDDEVASAHSYDSKLKAQVSPNLEDPNGPPSSVITSCSKNHFSVKKFSSISLGFTRTQKTIVKTHKKTNSTPWV